ncbi:uncharacterized protein A1O5_07734 [Cladophialophora psammophila CBS 110553]|uniref:Major facilitator superfamily (MFS) profile domain-containing protein n=1 Tax=Cladophialophora psammophila CBS 110553 TaxID=1182543 RepID=W9WLK1_9EURO|nr:uncharacterized protein A1O5_07734 [Cladophialophora psammophila CBS 110553]EXJ68803.1 hypothetical protein A1O5_07734 [Cladophialophora psammophila CBS 110553]
MLDGGAVCDARARASTEKNSTNFLLTITLYTLLPWRFLYDQGVSRGVVVTQDFLQMHNLAGPSKTSLLGTVTTIDDLGWVFGAVVAVWLGERLGRGRPVSVGTSIMSVGAILQICIYCTA